MDTVWLVLAGWLALSLLVASFWAIVRHGASERAERLDAEGVRRARAHGAGAYAPLDDRQRAEG